MIWVSLIEAIWFATTPASSGLLAVLRLLPRVWRVMRDGRSGFAGLGFASCAVASAGFGRNERSGPALPLVKLYARLWLLRSTGLSSALLRLGMTALGCGGSYDRELILTGYS